ncbi:MAG: hypothetical protein HYV63_20755 [Candidatus Schekmanbacteria bacterium]|nr:hypothetical protein [Candidatus Schekmanbacteria bacterium]
MTPWACSGGSIASIVFRADRVAAVDVESKRVSHEQDRGSGTEREIGRTSRAWLGLAIVGLLLGGLLSFVLVAGRAPLLNQLIQDPLFARRCLVIHVNLMLGSWLSSFIVAFFSLTPGKERGRAPLAAAVAGVAVFVLGGFATGAEPVLSNYVPAIDHPVFLAGIGLFGLGVAAAFLDARILGRQAPGGSGTSRVILGLTVLGLRTAALLFVLGYATIVICAATTPRGDRALPYYEIVFWGGGHLFQLANVAALLSAWTVLSRVGLDTNILSPPLARVVYGSLLVPAALLPVLLWGGTAGARYYPGFESVMRWGTWPGAALVIVLLLRAARGRPRVGEGGAGGGRSLRAAARQGLLWSVILLLVGCALGAFIDRSTTLIPAHYHATIGAVTVSFMALTYVLLEGLGKPLPAASLGKWAARQPLYYGIGQVIFSLGFAYGGLHGLGRKVYGTEQVILNGHAYAGLAVMGVGGLFAMLGGGVFMVLVYRSWFAPAANRRESVL